MPTKLCGKCEKTVYPTEELKCLDKVWHKGCFKCEICNMTLNMKNYKGYDKLPYCSAHYPTTKHTAVADTPEMRRIQENTKIQSNIQYHADFELQKGKKTDIAEDPEMMRVKRNMEVISNVSYHGDKERREQMEQARPAEQLEGGRNVRPNPGRVADMEPAMEPAGGTPYSNRNSASARQVYDSNVGRVEQPARRNVGSISDYDPLNEKYGSVAGQNNASRGQPPQQAYQAPPQSKQPPPQAYQPPPQAYQPPPPANPAPAAGKGLVCQAMYDYDAADADEVSFREGDKIVFCQPIDAGWMEGTVERTGKRGMLPSNYVEKMN